MPDRSRGTVIVVGAGIAGLAAARNLMDSRFDVLVMEARERAGGRLWTDDRLGAPVDLGAAWIHGMLGNPIFGLTRKFGLMTTPTNYSESSLIDDNGNEATFLRKIAFAARANRILPRLKRLAHLLEQDTSVAAGVRLILKNAEMSQSEMCFLNRHLIEFQALNAASLEEQSLFALVDGHGFLGGDLTLPQGFAQVVERLAVGVKIKYGETVQNIIHTNNSATVETEKMSYEADAVIVTLPLGVLKAGTVSFSPALPEFKQASMSAIKMGLFNKIAMRFEEPFWPIHSDLIELIPERHDLVVQFLNWYKYTGQPILIACIAADTARQWEAESNERTVALIMDVLKKYFGNSVKEPVSTVITRWGQDEFSRGSYSVVHPGATAKQFDALGEPVGRLFFAGEATSMKHQGTVHGAYLSGLRAAKQIKNLK